MQCPSCGNKKAKEENVTHKYVESGLDNIVLIGVKRVHCPDCGETLYNFGNMFQLHGLIADVLLQKKGELTGKEVRFLRKFLGYSGAKFAELMGYNPQSWSRIENRNDSVEEKLDKLVRFAVAAKIPDRNYDLHDLLLEHKGLDVKKTQLRNAKSGWKIETRAG